MVWPRMDATGSDILEVDVEALEDELGTTLPDDYRAFLLAVNGGQPSAGHRVLAIGSERIVVRDFHSLSDSGAPFDLATRIRMLRNAVPYPLIPIGTAAGSRRAGTLCLCLEGKERGSVWYLGVAGPTEAPAFGDWRDRADLYRVADTFADFLRLLRPLAS